MKLTNLSWTLSKQLSFGKYNGKRLSEKAGMGNWETECGEWWECGNQGGNDGNVVNQGGNAGNRGGNHFSD